SRLGPAVLNGLAELIFVEQEGKVDPGDRTDGVVAPGPRVDVEELELPVARVALELHLDQPAVIDRPEESLRQGLEQRQLDRAHEGAGAPEFWGMLAPALHDHRGE